MDLDLNYADEYSLVKKLRRERSRALDAVKSESLEDLADAFYNFSITSHNITDWIAARLGSKNSDVYKYVKINSELEACRDISNTNKHYKITRYQPGNIKVDSAVKDIKHIEYSADGYVHIYGEVEWMIKIDNGDSYSLPDFMKTVIATWESYLK
jgi:hypothetical protein